MATLFNKGFGRKREASNNERIPPGQYETHDFPVLTAGPTPRIPLADWTFALDGLVEAPVKWTWEQFDALPHESFKKDIHCVTKWSKLDTNWEGVSIDTLLEHVTLKPDAHFVMAYSYGGYTTNIPLDDLRNGRAFVGLRFEGLSHPAKIINKDLKKKVTAGFSILKKRLRIVLWLSDPP